jgi:beta-glucosidase-like glycosyl hydrolase
MVLPKKIRQSMLRSEWGVPQKHIAESVRRNVLVKNQRKATVNNLGKAPKLEEFLESSSRKFKRMITFQPPVSKQVKKLEEMTNEAQRRRSQLALEKFLLLENDNRNHVTPPQDEAANDTLDTMDVCDASTRTSVTP